MHLPDALDQHLGSGLFQNNPRSAQLHGLDKLVLIVGSGQDDHAGTVLGGLQPLQGGQTVQSGHLQIQQKDVRLELLQHLDHLATVLGLGHHFEIVLERQQLAETVPEDGMVVRHDDTDLRFREIPVLTEEPLIAALFSDIHFHLALL